MRDGREITLIIRSPQRSGIASSIAPGATMSFRGACTFLSCARSGESGKPERVHSSSSSSRHLLFPASSFTRPTSRGCSGSPRYQTARTFPAKPPNYRLLLSARLTSSIVAYSSLPGSRIPARCSDFPKTQSAAAETLIDTLESPDSILRRVGIDTDPRSHRLQPFASTFASNTEIGTKCFQRD